jgi:hypothetical protein
MVKDSRSQKSMLEIVSLLPIQDYSNHISTNELLENDLHDQEVTVNSIYQTVFPVVLYCNTEKLGKYVHSEKRKQTYCKIPNSSSAI